MRNSLYLRVISILVYSQAAAFSLGPGHRAIFYALLLLTIWLLSRRFSSIFSVRPFTNLLCFSVITCTIISLSLKHIFPGSLAFPPAAKLKDRVGPSLTITTFTPVSSRRPHSPKCRAATGLQRCSRRTAHPCAVASLATSRRAALTAASR